MIFFSPVATQAMEFNRDAILHGQWWRLITGHLTHWTAGHLGWDLVAFLILSWACRRGHCGHWIVCIFSAALVISAAILLAAPSMAYYRGLSGVDSALLAWVACDLLRRPAARHIRRLSALVLLGFAVKLAIEWHSQAAVFAGHLGPGVIVLPMAHAAGFLTGLVLTILNRFIA